MTVLEKNKDNLLAFLFTDKNLKIALLDKGKKKLDQFLEFPLPEGLIKEGEVANSEKLGLFLKEVEKRIKRKESSVVVGISEYKSSLHDLVLPQIEPNEVDQAIKLQAESILPFAYDSEYLDWMFVNGSSGEKNKILLSAVPKTTIDGYLKSFEKTIFDPIAFETTSLSLYRLLPPEAKKLGFAVTASDNLAVILLCNENIVEGCSVLRAGEDIVQTIQKMKAYFLKGSKEEEGMRLYLCGKNLPANLIPESQKMFSGPPVILKTEIKGVQKGRESELAILISLAAKQATLPQDTKTINILPPKIAAENKKFSGGKKENKLILLLSFLLLIVNAVIFYLIIIVAGEERLMEQRVDSSLFSRVEALTSNLSPMKTNAVLINKLSGQNEIIVKAIKDVLAKSSGRVELSNVYYDAVLKELTVSGTAKKRDDLLSFKAEVEKSEFISKAVIPVSALEREENVEFRLKVSFK